MHISIIHDVRNIFTQLGHSVKSDNLSYHSWVNGEKTARNKVIKRENFDQIDQKVCDKFYKKYRKEFSEYDAFVHSYPPVFALLFEKFEKPIVTIACTRFDYPVAESRFDWYLDRLRTMQNSGQITPIANNLLDKKICEQSLGFTWEHISSLCNYMSNRYEPTNERFALWNRSNVLPTDLGSNIDPEFSISQKYDRETISSFKGVVHIPYNLSIMSAFEQYFQNIPLFFPSKELQRELYETRPDMLNEILFSGSTLSFDPDWIKLADWYDDSNMPGIVYFNSLEEVNDLVNSVDLHEISSQMQLQNIQRESKVIQQWENVIRRIA
jgi:hypothetical protein